jgi:NDP-hexose-3-ketoreductase
MKKVRIGVLGFASIAQKAIIPAIKDLPAFFEFIGLGTRTEEKKQEIINSGFDAFVPYEQIIDKDKIDALYIPLPNAMHFQWVKIALEKGLHVLVEKSLGCNLKEVEELNQLAQKNKLVLIENFQFRFHSQLGYIKDVLASGVLGEVRSIRSSFGFPPFSDSNNIRYQEKLGGGALLDAGAYPMKLAQLFLGNDIKIVSAISIIQDKNEVDIWGGGMIKQINGNGFLQFAFGFDHFYQCNIEIWGSLGKLTTNRIFTAPPGYSPEVQIETAKGIEKIQLESDNHYQNMLKHFWNCTQNQQLCEEEYSQNYIQAKLLEEFKKIANGK